MAARSEIVKHLMMQQGVTQMELAKRTGLSITTISRVLGGPIFPALSHWPAVLEALGLEIVIRIKPK